MAKVFFENRFLLTRKLHKEYCKIAFLKTQVKLRIICLILFVLFESVAAILFIFTKLKFLPVLSILIGVYFFYSIFYGYKFSEWINYRKINDENAEVEGGEVVMVLRFEPLNIHVKAGKKGYSFKYTSIYKVYETENLFIMIIRYPGMIDHSQLIFKNGFMDKSDNVQKRFKAFINEKSGTNHFQLEDENDEAADLRDEEAIDSKGEETID